MKRQSNIVAATLNNYERLEEILEISKKSAGSAMKEQAEYAKSIQYSIDTLKAAYQDFAQTVIDSGFIKNLLGTAQSFLEVLTKIIDKFGTIPTLLTGISAFGGFKGVGFFGQIADDATRGGQALTIFKKKLSDVVADYKSADAGKFGEGKFAAATKGIFGYEKADIEAIRQYNALIESGIDKTKAFEQTMLGASTGAQQLVQNSKTATVSIQALSTSERTAAIATKALGVALNAALTLGISLAISAIISEITKLANAEKEAEEKANQLREDATRTAETYKREAESMSELYSQYVDIVVATSDLTTEKEKLLGLQDKINDGIKSEREQVDLLNGSLKENIDLINKRTYEEAQSTIRDLGGEYQEALAFMEQDSLRFKNRKELYWSTILERVRAIVGEGNVKTLTNKTGGQEGFIIESGEGIEKNIELMDRLVSEYTDYLRVAQGDKSTYDMYKREYDAIKAIADKYREQYEQFQTIIKTVEEAKAVIADYGNTLNSEVSQRIDDIINSAQELSLVLNSDADEVSKYNAIQQLQSLKDEAYELAGTNIVLKGNIDTVFKAINNGINQTTGSLSNLREAWFESLEEMQKGALKTADSMVEALATITGGEGLSSEDFWNLMELDTNKILTDISMVGDKFVVSQEQLLKLKDQYIQSQIDSIAKDNDELLINKQKEESLIRQYELVIERWSFEQKNLNNPKYRNEYDNVVTKLAEAKSKTEDYGEQIRRNNILIAEWRSRLGLVANTQEAITKQIENLNKAADNLLKAQETKIDQIVDSHESEKEVLENEKALLEKELQTLEDQKSEIEDIISNYESVNKLVQDTVQKEIDALEEQKKAIEDTYSKRIDALKAENEERSDALEYAQKLANLENAKNNKRRVYDEARGWRYESVKEDVVKAENDLAEFENSQAIKQLEKERDREVAAIDDIIDTKKEYSEAWAEILDSIQSEEDELLAAEILGADWREKIASGDIDIMNNIILKRVCNNYMELPQKLLQLYFCSNCSLSNLRKFL